MTKLQAVMPTFGERYRIGALVGEGTTAHVYAAYDHVRDCEVAIKQVRAEAHAERLAHEFQVASRLQHRHLVTVYDYLPDLPMPGFTMERLMPLGRRVPPSAAPRLLGQLLLALDGLHRQGWVHRDLKPDNLGRTAAGDLKLFDLGMIVAIGTRAGGALNGTLGYAPPEAFLDAPLTEASDLYAVGVIAYEWLVGTPPFMRETVQELITCHLQMPAPVLPEAVPAPLAAWVMRLLAKEPRARFACALEALEALEHSKHSKHSVAATLPGALPAGGDAEQVQVVSTSFLPALDGSTSSLRLAVLERFGRAVAEAESELVVFTALLTHALDAIDTPGPGDTTGTARAAVIRLDGAGPVMVLGAEGGRLKTGKAFHVGPAGLKRSLDENRALRVRDTSPSGNRWLSVLALPLDPAGEVVLYLDREGGNFEPDRVWLLRALIQFARVAWHNARLIAQVRARHDRLSILNQVSLLVSGTLETQEVLQRLLAQVLKLTGAETALVIGLVNGHQRVLGACSTLYEPPDESYSRSAVQQVLARRQPICVLDTEAAGAVAPSESMIGLGLKSIMATPLEVKEHLLGLLYVSSRLGTRTFTHADLGLLRAIAAHAALALHNARQVEALEEKRAIESELALARTIQQGLFPVCLVNLPGLDVVGACQPAREVGGDFYDAIALEEGKVALVLGDVSGKSISAALYMAVVRTALRMAVRAARSPRECLIEVNTRVLGDLQDSSFVTCFLGIYDAATRTLTYATAGHGLGWLLTPSGVRPLAGRGLPIGLATEVFSDTLEEQTVSLAPGDRLVLFTDGVIEALDGHTEEYGEARLEARLEASLLATGAATASHTLLSVLDDLKHHMGTRPPWDDLTLLVARALDTWEPCAPIMEEV